MQEAKEHDHAQLMVEEGARLALEAIHMAEEEDVGLKVEEASLESEAEE